MTIFRSAVSLLLLVLVAQISGYPDAKTIHKRAADTHPMLRAMAFVERPYVFLKEDHDQRVGNDRYEGFSVDLLNMIASHVGFNFTLEESHTRMYGYLDQETGEWTGLIRELIDNHTDLTINALTITHEREKVIDFTIPYMSFGLSILYRKPDRQAGDWFFLLRPLGSEVWLCLATAYLAMSIAIFVLTKFSHQTSKKSRDTNDDQLTFCGSLRFAVVSGSNIATPSPSSNIAIGCWWFFTVMMICSYTANLFSFLTVHRIDQLPIESAEDLSKQSSIKYGCVEYGSTHQFFKQSTVPVYQRMFEFMSKEPSSFARANDEGIERVTAGNYAFIMESTMLEYIVARNCNLTQIGGLLDSKGYGIALPQNSSYREPISHAILDLQESGQLQELKERWWKGMHSCRRGGPKPGDHIITSSLDLSKLGGVFILLLIAVAIALVVAAVEFVWNRKTSTRRLEYQNSTGNICQRNDENVNHSACLDIPPMAAPSNSDRRKPPVGSDKIPKNNLGHIHSQISKLTATLGHS